MFRLWSTGKINLHLETKADFKMKENTKIYVHEKVKSPPDS